MSQKLRRVLLPVGVVDSGVQTPVRVVLPPAWVKVIGEGLLLKTREPLRCLWLSFTSFISAKGINRPGEKKDLKQVQTFFDEQQLDLAQPLLEQNEVKVLQTDQKPDT